MHTTVLKVSAYSTVQGTEGIVLQQELAAAGKRYGYDAGYVQATVYIVHNTASPLHHAVA